jgi:hypothetical protein
MSLRKTPHLLCGALRVSGCSWSLRIFRSKQKQAEVAEAALLAVADHAIAAID